MSDNHNKSDNQAGIILPSKEKNDSNTIAKKKKGKRKQPKDKKINVKNRVKKFKPSLTPIDENSEFTRPPNETSPSPLAPETLDTARKTTYVEEKRVKEMRRAVWKIRTAKRKRTTPEELAALNNAIKNDKINHLGQSVVEKPSDYNIKTSRKVLLPTLDIEKMKSKYLLHSQI